MCVFSLDFFSGRQNSKWVGKKSCFMNEDIKSNSDLRPRYLYPKFVYSERGFQIC